MRRSPPENKQLLREADKSSGQPLRVILKFKERLSKKEEEALWNNLFEVITLLDTGDSGLEDIHSADPDG